ncbi:DUF2474 family protein [Tropicimonas isoalkanivorans]|uniref:DUF2474 domain-containing protein n=1 Tax=Tropicimonas isoalkanivorans TaxID=441112 RepID=A0A1I1EFE6_9RHOB|nr:DUF2474 family protein [Tropicimonas isoalkanivorans]SFB85835.1 Protein of unknown function [Tropicimonas isoalkanivorans]
MAQDRSSERKGSLRRIAWFAGLYLAGILTLGAIAITLRVLIS